MTAIEIEEPDIEFEDDINDKGTYVIHEFEVLFGTDWPESLATRLGYKSAASLSDALKRWGRKDLSAKLDRVEWDPLCPAHLRTVADRKKGALW